jgi:Rod binding domain-containing protein
MKTHSIEFNQHTSHSHPSLLAHARAHSHPSKHGHAKQVGGHFAMAHPKSSGNPEHDKLVKQTQKWVSQTFYGEMLKQMRNSPFKDKTFDGGEGGQTFNSMFDQNLADKMSTGAGSKLVDSIVDKIEAGKNANKTQATKAYAAPAAKPIHSRIKPLKMSPALRAKIGGLG